MDIDCQIFVDPIVFMVLHRGYCKNKADKSLILAGCFIDIQQSAKKARLPTETYQNKEL